MMPLLVSNRTEAAIVSDEDVRLLVSRGDLTATLSSLASPSLLPQADDRLMFIAADCSTNLLLEQINSTGVVIDKCISAAHTIATDAVDWAARAGGRTSFTIIAHDSTGACHKVGDTFVVQLQSQQQEAKEEEDEKKEKPNAVVMIHSQQAAHPQAAGSGHHLLGVEVADHGDGTYEVSFVLPRDVGKKLCVCARFPYSRQPFLLKAAGL